MEYFRFFSLSLVFEICNVDIVPAPTIKRKEKNMTSLF